MTEPVARRAGLHLRKSYDQVQADVLTQALRRTLGPVQLILLCIACIIGAVIYLGYGLRHSRLRHDPPPTHP